MKVLADPVFVLTVRWGLAALFGFAVAHKLRTFPEFQEAVRAYRLLPERLTVPAAFFLIALELLVVLGLLASNPAWTAAAAALLCLYAMAMLINLGRGRRELDCGCGGPSGRQKIGFGLVLRNLVLAAMALLTVLVPASDRNLSWHDWFTALAASATMVLVWAAVSELSSAHQRSRSQSQIH